MKPEHRRLRVTGQKPITSGSRAGRPYTLYRVEAVDQHGAEILLPLRSWAILPTEREFVFEVKRVDHSGEPQFFLSLVSERSLHDRVHELEEKVRELSRRLAA